MKLGRMQELVTPSGTVVGVYFPDLRFTSPPEHAAEVRRGDAGFPVERVVIGERQRTETTRATEGQLAVIGDGRGGAPEPAQLAVTDNAEVSRP